MAFGDFSSLLDDFNRADEGPPPSSSWNDIVNGFEVVSNVIQGTSTDNVSNWIGPTSDADCECSASVPTIYPSNNDQVGVLARLQETGSSSTWDGYHMRVLNRSNDQWSIRRIDNGTDTQLGAVASPPNLVDDDMIGIECIGSDIAGYHNTGSGWSQVLTRSDSTYANAGELGVQSAQNDSTFDNFGGGPFAAVTRRIFLVT